MGFRQVYDYENGKRDWGSFGLHREGDVTAIPSAGEVARRDVPTCLLTDDLDAVRSRVREAGWDTCLVVTEERVVLGRLGRRALTDGGGTVDERMTEGPSTVRPSIGSDALLRRMQDRGLSSVPVTTPDGRLVGVVLPGPRTVGRGLCSGTPHTGSATTEARDAMSWLAAENIIAALDGKELPSEVDDNSKS
jgi:hypothetical protein